MYYFRIITLLFLAINHSFIFASQSGIVVKIRGEVSSLAPKELNAVSLKQGAIIYEDTSILTGKKSFVKIKMKDGSTFSVGPKSKLIINVQKKEGSLLSLLKGKIRVKAHKKKQQHVFIKTRTAAMGVRGTEFMVMFNDTSKRTSLLTYGGEVAISKIDKKTKNKSPSVTSIKKLLTKNSKKIKKADFTTIGLNENEQMETININPTQFVLLKKDNSLGTEKMKLDKDEIALAVKKVKRYISKKKRSKNIKQGGFISTDVGIYIPPEDEKNKKMFGKINSNGKFIPPQGLVLGAISGFHAANENDKEAKEKARVLNNNLGKQVQEKKIDNPMYKKYFEMDSTKN